MPDTLTIVNNKITDLANLYARMDKTAALLYPEQNPYELTLFDAATPLDDDKSISITSSLPSIYANALVTSLLDGEWQVKVEGKISERQQTSIKKFADDLLAGIDEYLLNEYAISSLNTWNANHACIRSIVIGRLLLHKEDERLVITYMPCDARWTPYQLNQWIAPMTWRTKAAIVKEYENRQGIDKSVLNGLSDKGLLGVTDYWDDKKNEVWITGQSYGNSSYNASMGGIKLYEQKNSLGLLPFNISSVSAGFMLRDANYLEHEYEDIFEFNRHRYADHNRDLSIKATMGMKTITPSFEREIDKGVADNPIPIPGADQTIHVPPGGKAIMVPQPDVNNAFIASSEQTDQELQMGGISNAELADTNENRTAIWLATQSRIRGIRLKPRMECLQVFRESLIKLAIRQIKAISGDGDADQTFNIGRSDSFSQFNIGKLGDPDTYRIKCRLMTRTKEEEIANIAEAAAAKSAGIPQAIIDRDILMAEDPEEWERQRKLQLASESDPALALFDQARNMIDEADTMVDDDEANGKLLSSKQLTATAFEMVRQRSTQPMPGETVTPKREVSKGNANALIGLGAGGGL